MSDGPRSPDPAAERDWTIRGARLPIDDAVDKYIKPRLRSDFRGSAYEEVRACLALAIGRAEMSKTANDAIRRRDEALGQYGRKARSLADSVQELLDDGRWFVALTDRTVRGTIRPPDAEHNARFREIDAARSAIARAEQALRTIGNEAEERLNRERSYDERVDPFRRGFIEQLVFGWTNLREDKLKPHSRPFARFVEAAIETAAPQPAPRKDAFLSECVTPEAVPDHHFPLTERFHVNPWDPAPFARWLEEKHREKRVDWPWTLNQCSEVIKEMEQRSEWDRADRYVEDLWPPGTKFVTPEQAFERRRRAFDNEIREYVEDMERGGPGATFAAAFLMDGYERASEQGRARYIELGFSPEVAKAVLSGARP